MINQGRTRRFKPARVRAYGTGGIVLFSLAVSACGILGPDLDGYGTVTFYDFEGGCWAIVTEKDRYQPTNLDEEFKIDGLGVDFEAEIIKGLNSPCQMGPLIELKRIRRVGSGQ